MPKKKKLNIKILVGEAARFAEVESTYDEPSLYGVTDGKAVGTYLEHKFMQYLAGKYKYKEGNSASGIDFPWLGVDMKVTSVRQPQSSCPFKSARQKIYGLGYHLIVFVYEKTDDHRGRTGRHGGDRRHSPFGGGRLGVPRVRPGGLHRLGAAPASPVHPSTHLQGGDGAGRPLVREP